MLQLGSTLGPYVVESLLAEGGMGAVYRARNRVTGQLRALKVVRPELAQKRDFVDRFVREATIASQLRHPNLVETLEPGIDGNIIYLPMELLEGETLAHHLKKKRRLTPAEAAELLAPVTQAVQALHDRGVVHRDLKPMNIFVTRAPNGALVPKVIDLGTARDVEDDEHTRTGMVVGSPFYMAPEQAEGRRDIDGRADQYALGVIAYQMITGARPYESDDTRSALAKLLRGEPFVPPSRHFPGLHAAVEAVIVKALEREREHRFARIDELGAALTAAAAGLPVATASPATMITEAQAPMPVAASGPGAFVVPPMVGPGPSSVAPPPGAPGTSPLGTPGPFAPPPEGTPPPTAARPRGAIVVGALVVLALLGIGTGAVVWTMSPTMTATPLAPRAPTLAGAGTEEPVMPPVTIPTTPVVGAAATGASTAPALDVAPGSETTPGTTADGPPGAVPPGNAGGAATAPPVGGASATPGVAAPGSAPTPAGADTSARAPATTAGTGSGGSTGSTGSRPSGSASTGSTGSGSTRSGSSGSSTAGSSERAGSGSSGSRTGGSRSEDDERGGGASHGAPCGAATGIPCLD